MNLVEGKGLNPNCVLLGNQCFGKQTELRIDYV